VDRQRREKMKMKSPEDVFQKPLRAMDKEILSGKRIKDYISNVFIP
jgi:hypothetical protein